MSLEFKLQQVYEAKVRCGEGLPGFTAELKNMLGVKRGKYGPYIGEHAMFAPTDVSPIYVAEAFMGRELYSNHRSWWEHGTIMEALSGGALTSAQLAPVQASYATITGLYASEMLKGYSSAPTMMRQCVDWKPGVMAEEIKMFQYTDPTSVYDDLQEGQERPSGNMNAEWVRAAKMREQGQTMQVSWRALHFAVNGESQFDIANKLGSRAAWVIEDRILDVVWGLAGVYKYGNSTGGDTETSYQTYIAGGGPYVNMQVNQLVDETSLQTANLMLRAMRNPSTGLPIDIGQTKFLLVSTGYEQLANRLSRFQEVVQGTESDRERLWVGQTTAQGIKPYVSARMEDRMTTKPFQGTQLNLTSARKRWLWGDPVQAFQYRQARDFSVLSTTVAENRALAQFGLIASHVYDEMGSLTVRQPRAVVLNTYDSVTG